MAISATQIATTNTLENFRQQFNNLQTDVNGLESGTLTFSSVSATTTSTSALNILEDGTIVFEGATDDGNETTLTVADPSADRTITLPDATGTVFLTNTTDTAIFTDKAALSSGDVASGSDVLLIADVNVTTLKKITVDNLISSAGGLTAVSADSTPQLGGDLDVNGNDIVSVSNGNINLLPNGSGKVIMDGNGSTGGISITDGAIDIRSGTGSVSEIKFYCEVNNAHAQTLKAQPHSAGSSAVVTLPINTGTIVASGDTGTVTNDMLAGSIAASKLAGSIPDSKLSTISTAGKVDLAALEIDGGTDIGADLTTSDLIIVDDGAGGTNRKAALSRLITLVDANAGFATKGFATAMAIAL